MNRRQRRLVNIRFWADQAIEAMRVQVSRLEGGSESPRVDLDFYLIAAWRLMEQIRQAWVGYEVPGAEDLWRNFNTRFPYIHETRDWWIHATDRIVNHSYFANDIMRWTQPPTFVIRTEDLPDPERMYERFCELLGPLPELNEPDLGPAVQCSMPRCRRQGTVGPGDGGLQRLSLPLRAARSGAGGQRTAQNAR